MLVLTWLIRTASLRYVVNTILESTIKEEILNDKMKNGNTNFLKVMQWFKVHHYLPMGNWGWIINAGLANNTYRL